MSGRDALRKGDWLGEYEIRGRMRAGGMATLFLAQRHGAAGVSRPVVIKVIHPHLAEDEQMVRMFIDEARISSHIRHSNVVYVEKFGEHEGLYFMVMEYVDGCSLLQVIRSCAAEGRKLSTAIAVHIAIEVAAGLHAAHETKGDDGAPLGIVHRDVSPSNVLLTRDGRVKVIDFGIAKAHGRLGATRSGSGIKGKLCYMSPEQAWGDPVDRRIDIYALGICLWELLTSQQLFRAESDLALLELVRNPTIPLASTLHPDVSAALDAAMSRATAPRPADRHATAFDLRRDLMAAVPGAVAVPPEMIGELVRHVCEGERRTAQMGVPQQRAGAQPSPGPDALLPIPAETSVRSAAGEIEPRPWRNRGILAAAFLGACALGGLVALAIASSSAHPPSTPAQAVQAPPPPPAADARRVQPASAASAADAPGARSANAAPTGAGSASATSTVDATGARSASATPAADATGAPTTSSSTAGDTTRAQATSAAATRAPAAPGREASPPSTSVDATSVGKRLRRGTGAPHAEKSSVTAVEVDGAVLADEGSAPAKTPARPKPKPAGAVRAGDAILAE